MSNGKHLVLGVIVHLIAIGIATVLKTFWGWFQLQNMEWLVIPGIALIVIILGYFYFGVLLLDNIQSLMNRGRRPVYGKWNATFHKNNEEFKEVVTVRQFQRWVWGKIEFSDRDLMYKFHGRLRAGVLTAFYDVTDPAVEDLGAFTLRLNVLGNRMSGLYCWTDSEAKIKSDSYLWDQQLPFSLGISHNRQTIVQGESASYTVTVEAVGGYKKRKIVLALEGLSANADLKAEFEPPAVTVSPKAPATTTLKIGTNRSIQPGTLTLTIIGRSGHNIGTVPVSLTITPSK